jgi:endonuclease/exonuclease/phosphatase family metal-dependent hydrolase
LIGYYGILEGGRRMAARNFLKQLSQTSVLLWCIIGDFNDIIAPSMKKGRNDRATWLINDFCSAVLDCGLTDIHIKGYSFTWFKSLGMIRAVEEKLDHALATETWHNYCPHVILKNLSAFASDHYPIICWFIKLILYNKIIVS